MDYSVTVTVAQIVQSYLAFSGTVSFLSRLISTQNSDKFLESSVIGDWQVSTNQRRSNICPGIHCDDPQQI
jgi:hypothetical protein